MNYLKIAEGLPVQPVLDYLETNPTLWDQITARQDTPGSPHHDTQCIFLRWCPGHTIQDVFYQLEAHDCPVPVEILPHIVPLVRGVLDAVPHTAIGRVILVSLKPGGSIDAHHDAGDYADAYDRFHVALQSDDGNLFTVGDEAFHAVPGEAFWFNVKQQHFVENHSSRPRIHLIVDLLSDHYHAMR